MPRQRQSTHQAHHQESSAGGKLSTALPLRLRRGDDSLVELLGASYATWLDMIPNLYYHEKPSVKETKTSRITPSSTTSRT